MYRLVSLFALLILVACSEDPAVTIRRAQEDVKALDVAAIRQATGPEAVTIGDATFIPIAQAWGWRLTEDANRWGAFALRVLEAWKQAHSDLIVTSVEVRGTGSGLWIFHSPKPKPPAAKPAPRPRPKPAPKPAPSQCQCRP